MSQRTLTKTAVILSSLAGWDEGEDLRHRFGEAWLAYVRSVRPWFPRLRPWHHPGSPPAHLFEHIHLGWALAGWTLRLPGIRPLAQLLTDASGGEPRTIGSG